MCNLNASSGYIPFDWGAAFSCRQVDKWNTLCAVAAVVFVTGLADAFVDDVVGGTICDGGATVADAAACGKLDSLKVDAVTDAVIRAARDVEAFGCCCA